MMKDRPRNRPDPDRPGFTASGDELFYGVHPVLEALNTGRLIDKILFRKGLDPALRKEIEDKAIAAGIGIQTVPPEKIENLCRNKNHQGVVAFASLVAPADLEKLVTDLLAGNTQPYLVMLDGVTDVRNFGAIARSAEGLGAGGIIIPEQGSVRVSGEAMRSSAGALHHIPVARVKNLNDSIYLLKEYNFRIIACHEKGKKTIFEADLTGPVCFLLGSEGEGISEKLLKLASEAVRIPMTGKIGSLNVSVATGVLLAESYRQRQAHS